MKIQTLADILAENQNTDNRNNDTDKPAKHPSNKESPTEKPSTKKNKSRKKPDKSNSIQRPYHNRKQKPSEKAHKPTANLQPAPNKRP